jgi:hypothetical protein
LKSQSGVILVPYLKRAIFSNPVVIDYENQCYL